MDELGSQVDTKSAVKWTRVAVGDKEVGIQVDKLKLKELRQPAKKIFEII